MKKKVGHCPVSDAVKFNEGFDILTHKTICSFRSFLHSFLPYNVIFLPSIHPKGKMFSLFIVLVCCNTD